ncbi:MAG TPA: hypothetical protein EYP48_00950 [Ignisphaera sp.]|uniref:Uncharacterized protein n=1 Tax=Ignisphaera aggregans TaxID=334771 RepID=A0A832YZJ0_9CREN|nr:hypothetical protein [Ignisphaera sp.]HIP57111.1 hypothetical protein [Ignisphaera aggregans]
MSESLEEVFEFTSYIEKDLKDTKRLIEESLSELGLRNDVMCVEEANYIECILTIPMTRTSVKTAEYDKPTCYIRNDTVYTSYVFINASYDNLSQKTRLRLYSYDYNDVVKKIVEVVEKHLHNI